MPEQHTAVGKETGETAHVERWNNTALAASGPFCPYDVVFFQVRSDARGLSSPLSPSLQFRSGYPTQVSHYPKKGQVPFPTSKAELYRSQNTPTLRLVAAYVALPLVDK